MDASERLIEADNARKQLAVTIADDLLEDGKVDPGLLEEYELAITAHKEATEAYLDAKEKERG